MENARNTELKNAAARAIDRIALREGIDPQQVREEIAKALAAAAESKSETMRALENAHGGKVEPEDAVVFALDRLFGV